MDIDSDLERDLVESLASARLVIVCGAGLSMAAPSSLPSAAQMAQECYDRYRTLPEHPPPAGLRSDLEKLAENFAERGRLREYFLRTIVPWNRFIGQPNPGHRALADFLLTRAVFAALTTNYDFLIEDCARTWNAPLRTALDGDEIAATPDRQTPYLKLHGCWTRDPEGTVWTKSQLQNDAVVAERIRKSKVWMESQLRERDLVFIGFWSDWAYLNEIVEDALTGVAPLSVTVVDPIDPAGLESKAPELWNLLNAAGIRFRHVQTSGADFLDALRVAFSRAYLRDVLDEGRRDFEEHTGDACTDDLLAAPEGSSDVLYDIRRDSEGVPRSQAAVQKQPSNAAMYALCHLLLRKARAVQDGAHYVVNGDRVRVVNGAAKNVATMKADYAKELSPEAVRYVVCAGGVDLATPANVVRTGKPHHIVRPAAPAEWLDLTEARRRLGF